MKQAAFRIHYDGRVQGVGFRWTVRSLANEFEVTGTVKNLDDGRVELCVCGEAGEVESFLEAIRTSGLAGHIETEFAEPLHLPSPAWKGFHIIS